MRRVFTYSAVLIGTILPLILDQPPAYAEIVLDRLNLRNGRVIVGKIIGESPKDVLIFTTGMSEETVPQSEIRVFEKVVTDANPFRAKPGGVFRSSVVTTVRLKDGKLFRGISLDRQGDYLWLLSPEAYLLQIPFSAVARSVQEPFDGEVLRDPVAQPPPSTGYAPELNTPVEKAAKDGLYPEQPGDARKASQNLAKGAAATNRSSPPTRRAPESAIPTEPGATDVRSERTRVHGLLTMGFHEPSSGALEQFYGSGLAVGAALDVGFNSWLGARVGGQYFSKTVVNSEGNRTSIVKIPIDVALWVEPLRGLPRFIPYFGAGPGFTMISQKPNFLSRLEEGAEPTAGSRVVPHYHLFVGGRTPLWRRLSAGLELRYSSAPFVDDFVNLNAGGVDPLLGLRW